MSSELIKGLIELQPDYRPATMWWWGDELCEKEITAQMEAFKEKGIVDFFVNHTWGALDEYLGERFFEMIKYTVNEAKRLGLSFWMYDEFNWPSGVAGGLVTKKHPEYKAKALHKDMKYLSPNVSLYDVYYNGEFAAARAYFCDGSGESVDVSDKVTVKANEHGFWLSYQNDSCADINLCIMWYEQGMGVQPAGQWGKHSLWEPGCLDSLKPGGIQEFIKETHEKYKAVIGDEFGKTVKGIFTDEIYIGINGWAYYVPWSDVIKDKFIERFGYDYTPYTYALIETAKTPEEKKVRYHYWLLVKELMRDNHLKAIYEWCDKENIKYTGHLCGEEDIIWSINRSGSHFEMLKWMHVPGIDSIYSRDYITNHENFDVAPKLGASCAKHFGRDRLLCETYTMSLHKLRYDEMRRIANRLLVLGVNMIQYMGVCYSMENGRKGPGNDISGGPSFGPDDPMFTHRGTFGDYVSRIQYLSAKTKPAGKVLLMCPQTAVCVNMEYDKLRPLNYPCPNTWKYEATNVGLINALSDINVEYDLFDDGMAADMQAADGVATFYGCNYDAVILPYTGETTRDVHNMIDRLKNAGVKLVFVNELPNAVVDEAAVDAKFGAAPAKEGVTVLDENVTFMRFDNLDNMVRGRSDAFKAFLFEALGSSGRTLDIKHDGDIYTSFRSNGKENVVFLCNDADEIRHASIAYKEGMQLVDPDTCRSIKLSPAGGRAEIAFAPYQMYILLEAEEKVDWPEEDMLFVKSEPMLTLSNVCDIELEKGNIITADWKYAHYTDAENPIAVPEDELVPTTFGRVPAKYANINEHGLMVFDFNVEDIPEAVTLFAEYYYVLRCELNGVRIDKDWQNCHLWGPHCASLDVTALLKKGANRLAMVFTMPDFNIPYEAPFMMLRGNFETDHKSIFATRSSHTASPVNTQGNPRFCGEATYHFNVTLTAKEAEEAAFLTADTREAMELFINGVSAGIRMWNPQKFNVEGMLKEGENKISLKLTLPMWNLLNAKGDELEVGLLSAPVIEKKL